MQGDEFLVSSASFMGKPGNEIIMVLVTASSMKEANKIAKSMIQEKRAACVNVLPTMTSIFHWQGKVQKSRETLLIFKTTGRQFSALKRGICSIHSYEIPEIISFRVDQGLPQYVDWVVAETTSN